MCLWSSVLSGHLHSEDSDDTVIYLTCILPPPVLNSHFHLFTRIAVSDKFDCTNNFVCKDCFKQKTKYGPDTAVLV